MTPRRLPLSPTLLACLLLLLLAASALGQGVQDVTIPGPPPTSFPDVRCLSIRPFIRTVRCVCYLVVSGGVKTDRPSVSRARCTAQEPVSRILRFSPACAFYRTRSGRLRPGKLLRDIRRIIKLCVDPAATPLRFVRVGAHAHDKSPARPPRYPRPGYPRPGY